MTVLEVLKKCGSGDQKRQPCFDALRTSLGFYPNKEVLKALGEIVLTDPFMGYGWQAKDVPTMVLSSIELHGRADPTLAALILINLLDFYDINQTHITLPTEFFSKSFSLLQDFGRSVTTNSGRADILDKLVRLSKSGDWLVATNTIKTVRILSNAWQTPVPSSLPDRPIRRRRPIWHYLAVGSVLLVIGTVIWRDLKLS